MNILILTLSYADYGTLPGCNITCLPSMSKPNMSKPSRIGFKDIGNLAFHSLSGAIYQRFCQWHPVVAGHGRCRQLDMIRKGAEAGSMHLDAVIGNCDMQGRAAPPRRDCEGEGFPKPILTGDNRADGGKGAMASERRGGHFIAFIMCFLLCQIGPKSG